MGKQKEKWKVQILLYDWDIYWNNAQNLSVGHYVTNKFLIKKMYIIIKQ